MATSILLPLDGSPLAARAVPYAVRLARASGGRIVLVRAVQARTFPGVDPTEAEVRVTREAEEALEATAGELQAQGVTANSHVYYDNAASALIDAIDAQHADLVVMSTHGRSGLGRWVYGSVAEQVLHRAPVPVLLIPPACQREVPVERPGPVMVALDGSAYAEEALAPAAQLAGWLGVDLVLAEVVEPVVPIVTDGSVYVPPFDEDAELANARAYLTGLQGDARLGGRTASIATEVGEAAPTLAHIADHQHAAAIALATHGRTGLARLALGSVAMATVQRADAPLLMVRPAGARAAQPAAASGPPVQVALSAGELTLVQRGLEVLRREADAAPDDQATIAALLARLRQVEPTA